jgi:hypothetical protein
MRQVQKSSLGRRLDFMDILGLIGLIILWGATFVAIFIFFLGLFYALNG